MCILHHVANLVVQTDGGLRELDCAAAAWVVGLWGDTGQGMAYEPLCAHGTFLDHTVGVFAAETIALDEATAWVMKRIERAQ